MPAEPVEVKRLPAPRSAQAQAAPALRRELGLLEVVTITVGSMIGTGIFIFPATVATAFPDPWTMAALWAAGGVVSMAGALSFAELVTMFPASGGPYVFAREAFGRLPGFLAGWSMLLGKIFVGPAVALAFALYVSFLFPLTPRGLVLIAAWALVATAFINWLGVRFGGWTQNVFTFAKVAALAVVIGLAAFLADPAARGPPLAAPTAAASAALIGVVFAYNSWFNPTFVAEEVKRPDRDLPLGLALGVALVTVVYVAASLAFWWILGSEAMAASVGDRANPVAARAAAAAVVWGGVVIAWGVLLSTFGNINGGTLVTARLALAMGRDGFLPRFDRVNARGTPGIAIWVVCAVEVALVFLVSFEGLAAFGTFVTWLFLAVVVASVYWFRAKAPDAPRPYRAWGYPVTPAVFLAGTTAFLVLLAIEDPRSAAIGLAVIAAGLPLFLLAAKRLRTPALA